MPDDEIFDLEQHSKLHVLSGGTKVVQHSPPLKTSAGLKGNSTSIKRLLMTVLLAMYGVMIMAVGLCSSQCGL